MEDELNLLDEINAKIPGADFQAEYYPGGMVGISMSVTAEMASQVKALAEQQGWPEADAYVAMLASGIGALKEARARELLENDSGPARDQLDLLVKQMRQMETQYAVLKYRTWNFLQAYQAAAMSRGALENRANGLAQVVNRLRAENDALRLQLTRTVAPNTTLDPATHDIREPQPPDQPNFRNVLRRLFKGSQPPSPTSPRTP
jgi:hypothetical protein